MHPSITAVLRHFDCDHLPEPLRSTSYEFRELAHRLAERLEGPELTVGLRKLLEAKDCMVRATKEAADKLAAETPDPVEQDPAAG